MGYLTELHHREHCTSSGWRYLSLISADIPKIGCLTEPHQREHCSSSGWRYVSLISAGIPKIGYLTEPHQREHCTWRYVSLISAGIPEMGTSQNLVRKNTVLALDGGIYYWHTRDGIPHRTSLEKTLY